MERFTHILSIVTLCIFLVVGMLILIITTPPGESIIRRTFAAQLTKQLGQRVEIQDCSTDLFSHLSFRHIRVYPAFPDAKRNNSPVFAIGTFDVRYDLSGLVRKRFFIRSVLIDSVSIALRRDGRA